MKNNQIYGIIILMFLVIVIAFITNYFLFKLVLSILTAIITIIIFYSSIKFSLRNKFIQFNLKKIFSALINKSKHSKYLSSYEVLAMSLAEKIGVGSLAGIALAIYYGGVGTVFWICLFSLILAINSYEESVLGISNQRREKNRLIGGPSFYIESKLKDKKIANLYAFFILISYAGIFLMIQANTILTLTSYSFNINKFLSIIILLLCVGIIFIKSFKVVSKIISYLLVFMIIIYLILALVVIFRNYMIMDDIIKNIFVQAFNIKSGISSFIYMIIISIQRVIFATESGIGTTAIVSSFTNNTSHNQGLISLFGVYVTTFLICLPAALIILTSNYNSINLDSLNGIEITLYAFNYHFGDMGKVFLTIITILFAYSTIISSYYIGEVGFKYLFKTNKNIILLFKLLIIFCIFLSFFMSANSIWNLVDVIALFLIFINVYAMVKISK